MSSKISIIVPVYNAEQYLYDCIISLLQQTYENIEIIIVDDGSTDQSYHIAKDIKEKNHSKDIKLINKKNGGQSSARNLGVSIAKGDYIAFVDSDDFITPIYCEELMNAVKKFDTQVAMCKFTKDQNELNQSKIIEPCLLEGTFLELIDKLYGSDFPAVSPTVKLYDSSLFKEISFSEGIIYEDGLFFYELMDKVSSISLVDSKSYYYRTTENSTLTSSIDEKNFDVIKKNELTEAFFKVKHPEALGHFYQKALNLNDFIAVKCIRDKTPLAKELIKKIFMMNQVYSKNKGMRSFLYKNYYLYSIFLSIMSYVYVNDENGKKNVVAKLIKKII
ncbi:glycosyltransferase family 2 protein [Enterococcus gallinarum]|uniref:Glycosyltransferase family 2 protein n=1 Tax=Enterococcus gallinarum TaxID=1353 RepID=A0A376GYT4_ENTGA|nr:glycosyltransferase family 2 protein [Enterococcus gallinarum]MDT2686683.1 glycosyltransferase family 2 protein [Enterococcus gallinarum]MDT2689479.1 glycosyltransferase family 2 protein [Enterococcus gallinarum]STD72539.1 Glycosyltransferases involved in cell wall biogenesis [Enterococcus gallinarum]STD82832.1 Glycosyltransferases involved in cell wall biogenesis [Enterococcus gallinarum]